MSAIFGLVNRDGQAVPAEHLAAMDRAVDRDWAGMVESTRSRSVLRGDEAATAESWVDDSGLNGGGACCRGGGAMGVRR